MLFGKSDLIAEEKKGSEFIEGERVEAEVGFCVIGGLISLDERELIDGRKERWTTVLLSSLVQVSTPPSTPTTETN